MRVAKKVPVSLFTVILGLCLSGVVSLVDVVPTHAEVTTSRRLKSSKKRRLSVRKNPLSSRASLVKSSMTSASKINVSKTNPPNVDQHVDQRPVNESSIAKNSGMTNPVRTTMVTGTASKSVVKSQTSINRISHAPAPPQKRWGLILDSFNEYLLDDAGQNEGDMSATNMVKVTYAATDRATLAMAQEFTNSWGTTSKGTAKFALLDPYVSIGTGELAKFSEKVKLKGDFRVYFPVSENSQAMGQYLYLRANPSIVASLGSVTLSYNGSPRYYFQQFTTFTPQGSPKEVGTLHYRYMHFVGFDWQMLKDFSFAQKLGLDHRFIHGDELKGIKPGYVEKPVINSTISYSGFQPVTLALGIGGNDRDLLRQTNDFSFYRGDETNIEFDVTIVF